MENIGLLIIAILGLFVGPVLVRVFGLKRWWQDAMNSYVLVAIFGIAITHILPHAFGEAGLWAVGAAGIGLAVPLLLERNIRTGRDAVIGVAVIGLALHAMLDGTALSLDILDHDGRGHGGDAHGGGHGGHGLALAVILHRLPVGLMVFLPLLRRRGSKVALGALAALAGATIVGFVGGEHITHAADPTHMALFEAFIIGALLHVVVHMGPNHNCAHGDEIVDPENQASGELAVVGSCGHDHAHDDRDHAHDHHDHHDHSHDHHDHGHGGHGHDHHGHSHGEPGHRLGPAIGAVLAICTIVFAGEAEPFWPSAPEHLNSGDAFLTLALESAPALVIAYALAGLMTVFIAPRTIAWMGRGSQLGQSARGMAFGLPMPICSCGVLPMYEALIRKGAPGAAAVAFLIATPELGVDAILLSIPLLGSSMTLARVAAAAIVALLIGVVVGRLIPARKAPDASASEGSTLSVGARIKIGLRYGFVELVDHTLPWILVGIGLAALLEPILDPSMLHSLSSWAQVPLFAIIGIPLYVCASGATPLAAVFIHKGVSAGAALAFLLTGPATNVTTFGVFSRLHGRKVAIYLGAGVLVTAVLLGWGVDLMFSAVELDLHGETEAGPSALEWVALGWLCVLMAASLWRQGPQGMLHQVLHAVEMPPASNDDEDDTDADLTSCSGCCG